MQGDGFVALLLFGYRGPRESPSCMKWIQIVILAELQGSIL